MDDLINKDEEMKNIDWLKNGVKQRNGEGQD